MNAGVPDRQKFALGKNPGRSRAHNRRVVLDLLRSHGQLGRKQIADMTQLTTQAVANIIEELLAENMLLDLGRLRSGRGQPPVQFALNPDGAITIGFEISVSHLVTTVLDLHGQIREQELAALDETGPAALIQRIVTEVAAIRVRFPVILLGVGVVMPGPFEIEGLSGVGPTTLPGWAGVDAMGLLARQIGVPVVIENDANAAAIGEALFGAGQGLGNFCMIYFSSGIGLGIIHDSQPLRGAFGNAGEVGHIVVAPGGRPCACGQAGCLERYASLDALRERLGAAGSGDPAALMAAGHPAMLAWIDDAAAHLAPVVTMLENILDPVTVILGGELPDPVIDALIALMTLGTSVANRRNRSLPRVIRGRTGQRIAALGAAALPFFDSIIPRLDTGLGRPAPHRPGAAPSEDTVTANSDLPQRNAAYD